MAELLKGATLQKKDGSQAKAEDVLNGKVVALYFSAHWCPPCRQFTPVLKDFYEELEGENFEIVFISFDRSQADLQKYLDECHGDWYHIPYGSEHIQAMASKYDVSGIPALIVIKSDGEVISKNARGEVQAKPPKAVFSEWKV